MIFQNRIHTKTKLEITALLAEYNDCKTANISTIASYMSLPYYMIFSRNLYFYLDEGRGALGEKIQLNFSTAASYEYHGILLSEEKSKTFKELFSTVEQSIKENIPIMLKTDVYDCKWNPLYQRHHIEHLIILSGYDKDGFYGLDPYFTKNEIYIPFDTLRDQDYKYISMDIMETEENEASALKLLISFLEKYQSMIMEKRYNFKKEIADIKITQEYQKNQSIYNILLMRKLKLLENNRLGYAAMLKKLSQLYNRDYTVQINELEAIVEQYTSIRMLILYGLLKGNLAAKASNIGAKWAGVYERECALVIRLNSTFHENLRRNENE